MMLFQLSQIETLLLSLPDWESLNSCAGLFVKQDSNGKGVIFDGPANWGHNYQNRIEALGMNFSVINVSETNELWSELESAKNNNEPIIIFNWSPNFTDALYGGEFISFPEYHDDCENDPTWGINSNSTHDCGSKQS